MPLPDNGEVKKAKIIVLAASICIALGIMLFSMPGLHQDTTKAFGVELQNQVIELQRTAAFRIYEDQRRPLGMKASYIELGGYATLEPNGRILPPVKPRLTTR